MKGSHEALVTTVCWRICQSARSAVRATVWRRHKGGCDADDRRTTRMAAGRFGVLPGSRDLLGKDLPKSIRWRRQVGTGCSVRGRGGSAIQRVLW